MKISVINFLTFVMCITHTVIANASNWILKNSDFSINCSIVDSITYRQASDVFIEQVWSDGKIIYSDEAIVGKSYCPEVNNTEYEYLNMEEDGIDFMLSSEGYFALLRQMPSNDDIVLVCGNQNINKAEYLVFNSSGYLKAMSLETGIVSFFYVSDAVLVIDQKGDIIAEIPYTEFESDTTEQSEQIPSRATALTRNPLYKALNLKKTISNYIKSPLKSITRHLISCLLNEAGGRYGGTIDNIIDTFFDMSDYLNLIELLEKLNEISFFGNAALKTLPSENLDFLDVDLPCEIIGLSEDTSLCHYIKQKYETITDFSYTLTMNLYEDYTWLSPVIASKSEVISSNGKYSFHFSVNKFFHTYTYEPCLKMDVTVDVDASAAYKASMHNLPPGYTFPENAHSSYSQSCEIYGDQLDFLTPEVGSSPLKTENIKDTSAEIVCTFPQLPPSASLYVILKWGNSENRYNARKVVGPQTVIIEGLLPMTEYTVFTAISLNGTEIISKESISFTTDIPDITGIWNCQQENWNHLTQQTSYETYSITLHPDKTVSCSKYTDIVSGRWAYSKDGKLTISIMDMATQTFNSGFDWTFKANDIKNPTKFTGSVTGWNFNNVIGYVSGDGHPCELTRNNITN